MVLVIFLQKKAPAASRQLEENCPFPKETLFWAKKKAPAASRQSEGKNLVEFFRFFFSNFVPDLGDEFG